MSSKSLLCADETINKLFGLNWYIRQKNTTPTVKHGGSIILLWRCFSAAGTRVFVRTEGKILGYNIIKFLTKTYCPYQKVVNEKKVHLPS